MICASGAAASTSASGNGENTQFEVLRGVSHTVERQPFHPICPPG